MNAEECEAQCHPGQEVLSTCVNCGGEVYLWSGHTDPTPWTLERCDHVEWPEKKRGGFDELMEDPCWSDRENSLRYTPRIEYWTDRGREMYKEMRERWENK